MKSSHFVAAVAATSLMAAAQESYWIANRASSDIMRISSFGKVLERVATPTTLRGCTTAPDGKVWIVRFGQPTVDIYDPVSQTLSTAASQLGSPYQIAFDATGNAWVSGGTGVQQFTAAGVLVQTYALTVAAPLGITIDADGNKWIAHRTTPASVSRIDPTGVVTNYPITGATMLPVSVVADFRGLLTSSRIWVIGDNAGQLAELDANGNTVGVYALGFAVASSITFDRNGDIWVGGTGGQLARIDPTNGTVVSSYSFTPGPIAMATDSLGRLRATARVTFSGAGPACETRRIDPATGLIEEPGVLTFGGFNAAGTQTAASTPFQYSLVVAPFGDLDSDGEANYVEILGGSSPIDATSTSNFRVETFGVTAINDTPTVQVQAAPSTLWVVGYALALTTPTPVPGFGGLLRLDPSTLVNTTAGIGNNSTPIPVPNDPTLVGFEFFVQGITVGATLDFQNVSGMKIW
jgi:streptogramin lyase